MPAIPPTAGAVLLPLAGVIGRLLAWAAPPDGLGFDPLQFVARDEPEARVDLPPANDSASHPVVDAGHGETEYRRDLCHRELVFHVAIICEAGEGILQTFVE